MEKTIRLPQGILELSRSGGAEKIVVAGGRRPDPQWLKTVAAGKDIYVADRGADHCAKAGLVPQYLYGDRDSAAPGAWENFVRKGAAAKTFLVNKDATDLSIVLTDMPQQQVVIATGVWGGRADHLFGNLYTLLSYQKRGGAVVMADDQEVLCFLEPGDKAVFTAGKRRPQFVSLLPLTPETTVSISGVRWPLQESVLTQANPYAVSNKMAQDGLEARCHNGIAGLYLTWKV